MRAWTVQVNVISCNLAHRGRGLVLACIRKSTSEMVVGSGCGRKLAFGYCALLVRLDLVIGGEFCGFAGTKSNIVQPLTQPFGWNRRSQS